MPRSPIPRLPLARRDLENLLASGLTDATIRANQLRTECNPEVLARLLNCDPRAQCCLGGLVFPYRDLNGVLDGFVRVRPHTPRVRRGKPAKYEQPKDTPLRAYFPAESLSTLRDGLARTFLTEGEKKALLLTLFGYAAVGLGGAWNGCRRAAGAGYELIPDLAEVPWAGRTVYVVFDWDPKEDTRVQVGAAARRLAHCLRAAGADEVYEVVLPPGPDDGKQGVDDFVVNHGSEAFDALVRSATPVPILGPSQPITAAAGRTDAANSTRFVNRYGDDVRLVWDGTRWRVDQARQVEKLAKAIAAELFAEIAVVLKEGK